MVSEDYKSIRLNNTLLNLHATTGIVAETNTRSETEVSGSGGGGIPNTHPGSSSSSPVHFEIKSVTTRYQEFFLIDEDGREHSFNLVDFDITCRKGNLLTVLGIKPKKDRGPYIAVYNHDTQIMSYDDEILEQYFRSRLLSLILYPTSIIITTVIALLIIAAGDGAAVIALVSEPPSGTGAFFMLIVFIVCIRVGFWIAKIILGKITNKKLKQFKIGADWKSIIEGFKHISKESYKVAETKT
ncbi:MAG: hypothetical protein ACC707_21120 [Thiohalomonadales bacterium]